MEGPWKIYIVKTIYFNLPSADRNTFILRTGYHHPERILHHIQSAIDMGFKVIISIQGTKEEQLAEASAIEERFPLAGITAIPSFDRCGILILEIQNYIDSLIVCQHQ